MTTIEQAYNYLSKDHLSNCGPLQVLRRGSGELIQLDDEGIILLDRISGTYMISAEFSPKTLNWISELPDNCELFQLSDEAFLPALKERYGLTTVLDCEQFVYDKDEPISFDMKLRISEASDEEVVVIRENYHKLSDEALELIRSFHNLFVAHNHNGQMIGFIGSHLEGSMGLLNILPEYRRSGYGIELEVFMINRFLEHGLIPYCQVEAGNEKSAHLQEKLGLKKAAKKAHWLY